MDSYFPLLVVEQQPVERDQLYLAVRWSLLEQLVQQRLPLRLLLGSDEDALLKFSDFGKHAVCWVRLQREQLLVDGPYTGQQLFPLADPGCIQQVSGHMINLVHQFAAQRCGSRAG